MVYDIIYNNDIKLVYNTNYIFSLTWDRDAPALLGL